MWTSQVYGHHDKMARTKTHRTFQNTEYTKTQQTLRNYKAKMVQRNNDQSC